MKKILISLLTLFYLNAFAGEIGYVWINDNIIDIKNDNLLDINSIIKIPSETHIYNSSIILSDLSNNYEEIITKNKCSEIKNYNNCISENLEKNLTDNIKIINEEKKVRILNYIKYYNMTFVLIEDLTGISDETIKKENKSIKEEIIIAKKDDTLCNKDESNLFSCSTDKKVISLCLKNNNVLSYKYGKSNSTPEMIYESKEKEDINKYFRFAEDDYSKGSTFEIEFNKGLFKYTLFAENHVYKQSLSGILVEKDNKEIARINCLENFDNNNLFELLRNKKLNVINGKLRYISGVEE